MSCVNKGNQIVSDGFCAGGRDWVVDLETDGLSREGRAVSQRLLSEKPGTGEGFVSSPSS